MAVDKVLESSSQIYNFALNSIENLKNTILKVELNDEEFKKEKNQIKLRLETINKNLNRKIKELENNSEWEKFTIAFYGETNAGKSTLIETLRILLNEENKIIERKKYNDLYCLIKEKEEEEKECNNKISEIKKNYKKEINILKEKIEDYNFKSENIKDNIEKLEKLIEEIEVKTLEFERIIKEKRKTSIKNFFLWLLKKLSEQNEVKILEQNKIENNKTKENLESEKTVITDEREKIEKEKSEIEIKEQEEIKILIERKDILNEKIENLNEEIQKYCDGKIIGDGYSDFTRDATAYELEYNGERFCLLDLPGIEGKEELVIENINKAVKKAHAVFYISANPNPPQIGDTENSGTIEKIRKHLGNQTEVYFIYNKKMKNPRQLKPGLINEEEEKSLYETDNILEKILKEQYVSNIPLTAYPAFLAVANCSERDKTIQEKFLEKFKSKELLVNSRMENFINWLTTQFVVDTRNKIERANYKKVYSVIEETSKEIEKQNEVLSEMKYNFERNIKTTKEILNNIVSTTEKKFTLELNSVLNEFEYELRNAIFLRIDEEIDNSSFKFAFEEEYKKSIENFGENLKIRFEKIKDEFQEEIKTRLEKYKKMKEELIRSYDLKYSIDQELSFKFDIEDGVNKKELIFSVISGIAGVILAISNPAGWLVLGLSILGAIVSVVKSMWGFFDHSYRSSQQRETANNKIDEMKTRLSNDIGEHFPEIREKLKKAVNEVNKVFSEELNQFENITNIFIKTEKELKKLGEDIKNKGGLNNGNY